MSATRDKSQKISFVYSNFYHLYKKGKDAAVAAETPRGAPESGAVLKTHDLSQPYLAIRKHVATEFIGKRVAKPAALAVSEAQSAALQPSQRVAPSAALNSLRENLKSLSDLHSKLRFMLQELEELVKE